MKITRLHKAKGYRIFRDFSWPTSGVPDFARFNVIYGWNGTGKTSLSNVFRMVQQRVPMTEGIVEIQVDQTRVSGTEFGSAALPSVRTFNRDVVNRNVFELLRIPVIVTGDSGNVTGHSGERDRGRVLRELIVVWGWVFWFLAPLIRT